MAPRSLATNASVAMAVPSYALLTVYLLHTEGRADLAMYGDTYGRTRTVPVASSQFRRRTRVQGLLNGGK